MMREKYDSLDELLSKGKSEELNKIKERIYRMLNNIRFKDGRSLADARRDISD